MTTFRTVRPRSRATSGLLVATLAALCAVSASAQAPPYALLQNSTLNGTGNTFTATYLPVVTSSGTIYVDLTVQFSVNAAGTLSVSSVQQVAAPTIINDGFVPGTYLGPDDAQEFITVSGPGVTSGGATEWSLAPGPYAVDCLYPYNAIWYDVGTTIANNPLYTKRLKKDGFTSTQFYQFGTGSSNDANCWGSDWQTNSLLGFAQTSATSLVIATFTSDSKDQTTPVDMKTYTLQSAK